MKKKIWSIILVLAMCLGMLPGGIQTASAEDLDIPITPETFPDPMFRLFVEKTYDTDGNTLLDPNEVKAAKTLTSLSDHPMDLIFGSLEGIEYLTNLHTIELERHQIQEADLSALTNLNELYLNGNGITSLTLPKTLALREVWVVSEEIESLDLDGCYGLQSLNIKNCKLSGSTEALNLRRFRMLTTLSFRDSQLTSADLRGLQDLEYVDLTGNKLTEIRMGVHPRLVELNIADNPVSSVDISSLPTDAKIQIDLRGEGQLEMFIPAEGVDTQRWDLLIERFENGGSYAAFIVHSIEGGTLDQETGMLHFNEGSDEIRLRLDDTMDNPSPDPSFGRELVLKKDNEIQVQFRVGNGTWADGTTMILQVSLPMVNGCATLPVECVPTGMIPWKGFGHGTWGPAPNLEENALTKDVEYVYFFSEGEDHPAEAKILFEVVNGTWSDGSTDVIEKILPLEDGAARIPEDWIPTGIRFNEDFAEEPIWFWNTVTNSAPVFGPISEMEIVEDTTFRCVFPVGDVFRVTPQLLIGGGEATLQYSLNMYDGFSVKADLETPHVELDDNFLFAYFDLPNVTRNYDFVAEDGSTVLTTATVTVLSSADVHPFTDVSDDSWYRIPVLWAYAGEIGDGFPDGSFKPKADCTRAQIVTFLWRASGSPTPETKENPFSDVKEGDWYYEPILWAVENGITDGFPDGTFRPKDTCTRAQTVTFLYRANGEPELSLGTGNPFPDVKNDWYYEAVLWAVENGITEGFPDGTFCPKDTCTRAQIVTFLYRSPRLNLE